MATGTCKIHCIGIGKELPDGSVDKYFFIFTNNNASDVMKVIQRFAVDDGLAFDWRDAGTVAIQVAKAVKGKAVQA